MLDDERESGAIHIIWTENKKFRVFTNIYHNSAIMLMQNKEPTTVAGYLDLKEKYYGQYSV